MAIPDSASVPFQQPELPGGEPKRPVVSRHGVARGQTGGARQPRPERQIDVLHVHEVGLLEPTERLQQRAACDKRRP